jgi:hypothetical protein
MKLYNNIIFLLIAFNLIISLVRSNEGPAKAPDVSQNDVISKKISNFILQFAEDKMKSTNLSVKRRMVGALPEGYPQESIDRALKSRQDIKRWNYLLSKPTELYRVCLYPQSRVNYVKWCRNNFFGVKLKTDSN